MYNYTCFPQVLYEWYQSFPPDEDCTVNRFLEELQKWQKEGYVDRDVWSHLQEYIDPKLIENIQVINESWSIKIFISWLDIPIS